MFKRSFTVFLRWAVLILTSLILLTSIGKSIYLNMRCMKVLDVLFFVVTVSSISFLILILKRKRLLHVLTAKPRRLLILLLGAAFLVRLAWIFIIPFEPASDFKLMFSTGGLVHKGNYSGFKGYAYFARFAHDTITVLYFSLFYNFMENPLILVKFFNVIFSTLGVYSIYLLAKEIWEEEEWALKSAALLAFFPPFIMYTSETMSENMALPLYILSMYFLLKALKGKKQASFLMVSGFLLSIGNMFRMVGVIFLTAYIVYLLIYKGFSITMKSSAILILSFILPMYITSSILLRLNVTETHLWKSKEPSITSILKGTNFKYLGAYNDEDASIPKKYNYDAEKITEAAKAIIKERFSSKSVFEILAFYSIKLLNQWSSGDFDAVSWTIRGTEGTYCGDFFKDTKNYLLALSNLYFIILLIKTIAGIRLRKSTPPEEINLLYILLGGFILLYLITESQARYSFIAAWLFPVFAVQYQGGYIKLKADRFHRENKIYNKEEKDYL